MTRGPILLLLGGSIGVLLPGWAHLPILLYAPMSRTWRIATLGAPGGPGVEITFYGMYLVAAVCALSGALLGAFIDRASKTANAKPGAPLLTAWALTALALATAYQLWSVWP